MNTHPHPKPRRISNYLPRASVEENKRLIAQIIFDRAWSDEKKFLAALKP